MSGGWLGALWILVALATVALYVVPGVLVARHEARRLYSVHVRYVRHVRFAETTEQHEAPLTEDETARVFREIRKDQREILVFWPRVAARNAAAWNRNRRKAKVGDSGGWMLAGARAADDELAAARVVLEVWEHEVKTAETDLAREAAQGMVTTTRETIARLEGRNR